MRPILKIWTTAVLCGLSAPAFSEDLRALVLSRADSAARCAALYDITSEVAAFTFHDRAVYMASVARSTGTHSKQP